MQPGSAQPTSHPDAVVIPDRPDFVDSFVQGNRPIPATAVLWVTPEPERRRTSRPDPDTTVVYMPEPSPEMQLFARCFAHAYITPPGAPCKAHPAPFIRAAIGAALPSLRYELLPPGHGADRMVLVRTPEFALDDGASVQLVREGETSDVQRLRLETFVHVALHGYPRELRSVEGIRSRCITFGHLFEVDPACFAAPDLSPVRIVVRTEHAREIPRQVRIWWPGGAFRHAVPVQILRVWDVSECTGADGEYVPNVRPRRRGARWPDCLV